MQFVTLPLSFLSTTFMARDVMPGWIQNVARFNPVDWSLVGSRAGYLAAFAAVSAWLATRAFRAYQRSV